MAGGASTTAGGGGSGAVAAEARDLVRGAVGDAAGLTIKGQVRRAAQNLGYPADAWRVREAFYGRAGSWSAAALDDLRRRHAAWRARSGVAPTLFAQRVEALRDTVAVLARQLDELAAEVAGARLS